MEICNFTSLFEIFCTIYLAYTITDNFSESNFIATITEKILRKYHSIDLLFSEINEKILGSEITLKNLEIPKTKDYESNEKHFKSLENNLEIQKSKIAQSKKEVYSKIKDSYQTKAFSFISLYLALYCVIILIYSGVCQAINDDKIVNSLLSINAFTLIFLYFGWSYDTNNFGLKKKGFANRFVCWFSKFTKVNGYVFTLISLCAIILISVFAYFVPQISTKHYTLYHHLIVLLTIFIPILNFIVYFIKASNKANLIRESLTEQVKSIATEVPRDLKDIEDFLTYFRVDKKIKIQ